MAAILPMRHTGACRNGAIRALLRCSMQSLDPRGIDRPGHISMSTAIPSASFVPMASGDDADRTPSRQPAIVLGANAYQRLAWWMDPIRTILFVVLPIFCFSAYLNQFNYWTFQASQDFVTSATFSLGIYSAVMLIFGIIIARRMVRRQDMVSLLDGERAMRILVRIGWVTIAAYVILFGALAANLSLVVSLFRGNLGASDELRDALGRVPGITSFVQLGVIYFSMASMLVTMTNFKMTPRLWTMSGVIFLLVLLRSVFASERLALLEGVASIGVIPLAYRWRPSLWRMIAPYIGIVFVFLAFAAGEYLRSWQYYQYSYDSYADFITQRFAGYFSTAINNGSGAYLVYGKDHPVPEITVGWVTRFPVIGPMLFGREGPSLHDQFLQIYASPEFNNPGGLYAAFLDYKFFFASLFMVAVGVVIGIIHRLFQNKSVYGFLLYPIVFLGMTDLIRIMYISDTRTLPMFLGGAIVVYALHPLTAPRDRFLSLAASAARRPSA